MSAFAPGRNEAMSVPPAPVRGNVHGKDSGPLNFLSSLKKDDYILAGIIIALIMEGCDDYILLAALGYLFIMGFKG